MRITTFAATLYLLCSTTQANEHTTQDLILLTRYANLTANAESFVCKGGCRGSEADGCAATRDFIVGGQCLAEDDGVWVRYLFSADFGLCVTRYNDPTCTGIISEDCGLSERCVDGWLQYELFRDYCVESSLPTREFVYPFVYSTTHRSATNCTRKDPPTVEDLRLGSDQICVATNIPMSDGSYGPGSIVSACQSDNSHVVTFYSDTSCSTQDGVLAPTYRRPLDQCTPGVTEETRHRMYTVECGSPIVHCKMPRGNSFIINGHASEAEAMPHYASGVDGETSALRGSARRELRPQHPCTIIRVETKYDENSPEFLSASEPEVEFKCALHPADREAAGRHFVDIHGVDTVELINVTSGETTLEVEGAIIADGAYTAPAGAKVYFGTIETRRRLSNSKGTKKVLVVRATTSGGDTFSERDDIVDAIFGTFGNPISLRSQYLGCSHNKIDFTPFEGTTHKGNQVTDGIITVDINRDFRGLNRFVAEEGLTSAAENMVGDLEQQFDHVILCLPPGTSGGWVAYAYVNGLISVFNDRWCEKLSTLVHEVGHNLNLAHSGSGEGSYHDKHCIMGFSYNEFFGPRMCFNPAKNWQLGWYDDQAIEWNPNDGTFIGTLVGVEDYGKNYEDFVVVKIKHTRRESIHIGYNRAKGYNQETRIAQNMITVVSAGEGYSESTLLETLSVGGSTTFSTFGTEAKDLTIQFLLTDSTTDQALIAISYGDCVFPTCCRGAMCLSSTTLRTPTNPTLSPVRVLTPEPTPVPTPEPSPVPTPTPVSFQGTGTPELLLSEDFSMDMGSFTALGERISREYEDDMNVATFELDDTSKPPRLETDINLNGNTILSVFFWFKASELRSDQSIIVRYSLDGKETWSQARELLFGYDQEFQLNQWYRVTDAFFIVPEGTRSITLQIFGRTGQNAELEGESLPDENSSESGQNGGLEEELLLDDASTNSRFSFGRFVFMGDRNP
ncbi:gametolysin peptidase M11 [Nitzschia inconspicua]|uniref:Gametolysin peptidase M11 n=1 Tax=Nitzschia inconspicua TaxID=303405 RepID=A0A9K3M7H6_9STRA|nr:gametolysin peptidase M11 [Nitzschia inconspicua]